MKDKMNKFSVPLGLLDYGNPILYAITTFTIINKLNDLNGICKTVFTVGAIISLVFGLIIPTGKVMVGLGIIKFKMPVILVFLVNMGILLSGLCLLKTISHITTLFFIIMIGMIVSILIVLYFKTKKTNTIAVLTGAFGYLLIYLSLIIISIRFHLIIPIILYFIAIILFIILCGIGIKGNLKNPILHWIIESSNILCQFLVAVATYLLLK